MSSYTAFVLGGGGQLGAHEVGMLGALLDHDVMPDLIVGTSIGAINGAMIAADPSRAMVNQMHELWTGINRSGIFAGSLLSQFKTLARSGTHLHDNAELLDLLIDVLPVHHFDDLAIPLECVATNIEQATVHYFSTGSLVDAVMASCAVPGLLPPVEVNGEHFLDGGLVASIPLDRAIDRGAETIYVLQVGRIEQPLVAPTKPWEVAMVAFEVSRRHRFAESLASLPEGIVVHVLPTGDPKSFNDLRQYKAGGADGVDRRINLSRLASNEFLAELL